MKSKLLGVLQASSQTRYNGTERVQKIIGLTAEIQGKPPGCRLIAVSKTLGYNFGFDIGLNIMYRLGYLLSLHKRCRIGQ